MSLHRCIQGLWVISYFSIYPSMGVKYSVMSRTYRVMVTYHIDFAITLCVCHIYSARVKIVVDTNQ